MSAAGLVQFLALLAVLALTAPPLGRYMAAVYGARADGNAPGDRFFVPVERGIYRLLRVNPRASSDGTSMPSPCSDSACCRSSPCMRC